MKNQFLLFLAFAFFVAPPHAFATDKKEKEDKLCKMGKETVALKKSRHNNGKKSDGVVFSDATKLDDGFVDKPHSVLNFESGDVLDWYSYKGDIQVADPGGHPTQFFLPNSLSGQTTQDGKPAFQDPDGPEAGIQAVVVDDLRNGVICPDSGYTPDYFVPQKSGLYCVRARHKNSDGHYQYAVIQVDALCHDGGLVFSWVFQPSGDRNFYSSDSGQQRQASNGFKRGLNDVSHDIATAAGHL